jgi:hypothetical protein
MFAAIIVRSYWRQVIHLRHVIHHLLQEPHNTQFVRTIEMMLEDQHVLGTIGVGGDSMDNIICVGALRI